MGPGSGIHGQRLIDLPTVCFGLVPTTCSVHVTNFSSFSFRRYHLQIKMVLHHDQILNIFSQLENLFGIKPPLPMNMSKIPLLNYVGRLVSPVHIMVSLNLLE